MGSQEWSSSCNTVRFFLLTTKTSQFSPPISFSRHAHKSTVMDLKWNDNGNWLVTASRDHLLKLFDLRNLSEEVQIFRGHKKEASAVSWHPIHEGLFSSGGSDGSVLFWNVGTDKEVGAIDTAHDSIVWTLAWHPLGHILCSGSNDHTIKFWTRNRPGDQMRDRYNLNTLPASLQGYDDCEIGKFNLLFLVLKTLLNIYEIRETLNILVLSQSIS